MSNDFSGDGQSRLMAKATLSKWHTRLQRELLKIWLASSALWVGYVLAVLGQCVYGRWFGWHQPQCDAPLFDPVGTYIGYIATAAGPPAAILLMYWAITLVSRRVRSRRLKSSKAKAADL
jgi:hypothetical protein